jgi:hypothetical protein
MWNIRVQSNTRSTVLLCISLCVSCNLSHIEHKMSVVCNDTCQLYLTPVYTPKEIFVAVTLSIWIPLLVLTQYEL